MSIDHLLPNDRPPSQRVAAKEQLYADKTGTNKKPNPMRDVYLEFPRAMTEIAKVTAFGATKHARRGWQTFGPGYGMDYHQSKIGRHLLAEETEGAVNHADGGLLHPAQVCWNALAYLENYLKQREAAEAETRMQTTGPLENYILSKPYPEAPEPKKQYQTYSEPLPANAIDLRGKFP